MDTTRILACKEKDMFQAGQKGNYYLGVLRYTYGVIPCTPIISMADSLYSYMSHAELHQSAANIV